MLRVEQHLSILVQRAQILKEKEHLLVRVATPTTTRRLDDSWEASILLISGLKDVHLLPL